MQILALFALVSAAVAASVRAPSTMTFDKFIRLNDGECNTAEVSPAEAIAYGQGWRFKQINIANTTSTLSCHQHSGGGGPWGYAVSQPNVAMCEFTGCEFLRPRECADVYSISVGTSALNRAAVGDFVEITVRGRNKHGAQSTRKILKYGDPSPVTVKIGGKFEKMKNILVTGTVTKGGVKNQLGIFYLDDLMFRTTPC